VKREGMSRTKRFAIFRRDNFTCFYCGVKPPGARLEVDHYVPVASGGSNDDYNLITSCFNCNRGKGDVDTFTTCETCVRPLCGGPGFPRDQFEELCDCSCHPCPLCAGFTCKHSFPGNIQMPCPEDPYRNGREEKQ